jgi:hypothetical protein
LRKQKERYVSQKQDGSPARDGESNEERSKRKHCGRTKQWRARRLLNVCADDDEVAQEEEEEDKDAEKEDEEDEDEN